MSKEAMKLAMEALGQLWLFSDEAAVIANPAITALRKALAEQPAQQQEPVAVVSGYYGGQCIILPIDPARIFNSNTALYISPPPCPTCEALARTVMLDQTSHDAQRQWVGLTEEEHTQIAINCGCMSADWVFYGAAVERNLKEKNT